ncbi:MAG: hypothetical protein HN348_23985 [Proteobacteria bacterium]|jgi:hypothetical protein|nr:hypothetical protein [Pseudomonadota bacterium]
MMVLLTIAALAGPITISAPPTPGHEIEVTYTDKRGKPKVGATISVIHRPGLDGEQQLAIGITDSRGRVRWTPEQSGVASIKANDDEFPLRISWPHPPSQTALLLGLLFLTSIGTAVYGWRR